MDPPIINSWLRHRLDLKGLAHNRSSLTVIMEKYNADLKKKNDNFKKRKLIQQLDQNKDSEKHVCELVSATDGMVERAGRKTDDLYEKLLLVQDKLDERELLELERTKKMNDLSSEVTRLQDLLSHKNEATVNVEMIKKEPPKAIISEEGNASQKEVVNQCSCRSDSNGHGGEIVSDISAILRTLVDGVLGMRVSFGPQSAEVIHEKSGYAFSLTLSANGHELVYRVSSLGTLEKRALKWMKEEIMFNTTMCPIFFQRICGVIGRA